MIFKMHAGHMFAASTAVMLLTPVVSNHLSDPGMAFLLGWAMSGMLLLFCWQRETSA